MKSLSMISLASIIFMVSMSAFAVTADSFKLVKQEDQIFLYERWVPRAGGDVREIKARFLVRANFITIINLLTDQHLGTQWNASTVAYNVLITGSNRWVNYIRYHLPWPFDDQDCCLLYQVANSNSQQTEITFSSTDNTAFSIQKNITRLTGINGSWLLEQKDNGYTMVTYTIVTDRNIKVPRCISDPAIHNNLFKTIISFKSILERN